MYMENISHYCVLFRVDSNRTLGLGHLNRCLSISHQLKKKKVRCIFVSKYHDTINHVNEHEFEGIFLQHTKSELASLKKLIIKYNINSILIDSKKKYSKKFMKEFSKITKIIIIDSLVGSDYANLIILPGLPEQFSKIPSNALVGKKYVILNSNIIKSPNKKSISRIVISLGGSDKFNITEEIVKAFLKNPSKFKILIILGKYSTRADFIQSLISNDNRFELKQDPKNYTDLVASSKLGIFSFGISVYEAAVLRLPLVVLSHSNENHKTAKNLEKYGWFKYVGKFDEINYSKLVTDSLNLYKSKQLLDQMKINSKIIDTHGSTLVAKKIIQQISE